MRLVFLGLGIVILAYAFYFNSNFRVLTTETKILGIEAQTVDWGNPEIRHLLSIRRASQEYLVFVDIEKFPHRLVSMNLGLPLSLLQPYSPEELLSVSQGIRPAGDSGGDMFGKLAYLEFTDFPSTNPVLLMIDYDRNLLWIAENFGILLLAVGAALIIFSTFLFLRRRKI